jgi:hypothetical protein
MGKWILVAIVFFGLWSQAQAKLPINCVSTSELEQFMLEEYQETLVAWGFLKNGGRVNIFVSKSDTWTIVLIGPRVACAVASGDGWRDMSGERL